MTDVRLCFDVGGTYIKFGVFTEKNQWLDRGKIKTPSNTRDEFFAALAAKIQEVEQAHVIEAIGLSFPFVPWSLFRFRNEFDQRQFC